MNVLHVVCTYPSEERPFEQPFTKAQVDSLKSAGINIFLHNIKGYESTFNYFRSIRSIRKIVQKNNVDIIHCHYSYAAISAFLSQTGVPIIVSLMGSDLLGVPSKDGNLTLRGKFDRYLSTLISKKVNSIIVKSEEMRGKLDTHVPINVIPNGVDFEKFIPSEMINARKKLGLDDQTYYILFLGNTNLNRKNFTLAELSIANLKREFGNKHRIELLTPFGISSSEVVDYMNASNVLLQTSYWEGSPNVIKEAMACNLPIVSTDVGDVKEIISNTKNCYLVRYDSELISNTLKSLLSNYSRTDGREKISQLRIEEIAKKIIDVYNKLI